MREEGSPMRRNQKSIPLEVKSKITKRSIRKVFEKVKDKIADKLVSAIGEEHKGDIDQALKDKEIE